MLGKLVAKLVIGAVLGLVSIYAHAELGEPA